MSDNSSALAALRERIEQLRALQQAPARVAPLVAEAVHTALVTQIAGARFPSGAAWPSTQEGKRALVNAAGALAVRAIGSVIVARLSGPEARHSVGAVRGHIQRQILPSAQGQLREIGEATKLVLAQFMRKALT